MNQHLTVPLQIKALANREFEGHGSIFGNVDYGRDVVLKGAFLRTLKEHGNELPPMFWMHDASRVPGKWTEMREDEKGLYVKGVLAKTDLGNEIHTLLKMEAVRGMSIGYMTREADYDKEGNRLLRDVDLFEVSIVSLPMNPRAQVTMVKSRLSASGEYVPTAEEFALIKREMESVARSKGFGRRASIALVTEVLEEIAEESSGSPGADAISGQKTPEGLEVQAGADSFNEKLLAYELEQRLRRFRNG